MSKERLELIVSGLRKLISSFLQLLMLRRKSTLTEHEQYQLMLENSSTLFFQLSQKQDIDSVTFAQGEAIITLKDNRRFHFDPLDRVARMYTVPHIGTFEAKETDFVRSFAQPGMICFDIGASFGWYTILLSKIVGPTGQVHAFEPLPHTFEVLERNVILNECLNVTLDNVALDKTNGQKDLFLPDIGVSGSFHLHEYDKEYETISCPTKTLDDYCLAEGLSRIDFIKADIEGAEWDMLKGALETIRRHHPVLLLEMQSKSTRLFGYDPVQFFAWLVSLGYVPHFAVNGGNLVPLDDYHGELPDHNFIFLPSGEE